MNLPFSKYKKPVEPTPEEKKETVQKEQGKTDVAIEFDPTVPEEEKKKVTEQKKEAPKEPIKEQPPKDTIPMKLTDLQLFTASVNTLAQNTAELKILLANQKAEIELMRNNTSMIRDDTASMEKHMQEVDELKVLIHAMDVKMENMKIKWDLTQTPITDRDISDGLEKTQLKEEYTTLNNIVSNINNLKKKIEKRMDDMSQEEGYEKTKEYRDLYTLGMLVFRLFNVWPPKMRYFGRNEKEGQPILLEMTEEQAHLLDLSERREQEERDKVWENLLSGNVK